jgi:hypothetical protein
MFCCSEKEDQTKKKERKDGNERDPTASMLIPGMGDWDRISFSRQPCLSIMVFNRDKRRKAKVSAGEPRMEENP